MGECFITRRGGGGGGSGKLYAAIGVTYPTGSTCTCSDGSKTLKAKTTSGTALFSIPYAGTWTITATDGSNSDNEVIEITEEGQVERAVLEYIKVLFDNGDKCTAITGGWTTYASGAYNRAANVSDTLYVYVQFVYEYNKTAGTAYVRTTNPISISGGTLEVTVSEMACTSSIAGTYHGSEVRVSANENLSSPVASYTTTKTGAQTITLPLSNLSGEYYVGIYAYLDRGGNDSTKLRVTKMQII